MTSALANYNRLADAEAQAFGMTDHERFQGQRWWMGGVAHGRQPPDLTDDELIGLMQMSGFTLPDFGKEAVAPALVIVRRLLAAVG